ncbi:MAG: phosphate ABC transporter substrate-binding protein [Planctomycetaceae bacterium]|nr:phosphate ABC transporter substrate-binding protein [Planctomycetaceae bacterium]
MKLAFIALAAVGALVGLISVVSTPDVSAADDAAKGTSAQTVARDLPVTEIVNNEFTPGSEVAKNLLGADEGKGASDLDKIVDEIPVYKTQAGVAGNLSSIGSDTLNNLMAFWKEGFQGYYPNVKLAVEGKGTSTAPPALIDGTADFGPMSRPMKNEEIDKFEKKYGYKPSYVAVAIDALAVFVHKDNPIKSLTLPQVDAIFSSTRKLGYKEDIVKWGQAGLQGNLAGSNITLYGRNSASGTYGFFKEHTLGKGDYKATVKEQPGSATVVTCVSEDTAGIGYSGIGYMTAGVRAVPLAKDENSEAYEATSENAYSGKYPLWRFLYIYYNKKPGEELRPAVKEFLNYALSREGQKVVIKDGYIPMSKALAEKETTKFNTGK